MELLGDPIDPIDPIDPVDPVEVWRTFLYADFCSQREGTTRRVTRVLNGKDPALREHLELGPDGWGAAARIGDALAASIREALLECHGGTLEGLRGDINGGTDTMVWRRARIDGDDDLRLLAIGDFEQATTRTLLPARAEQLFRTTRMLDDVLAVLDNGDRLPPMICIATEPEATLFVLDGNQRVVALRLRRDWPVEVMVGFSQNVPLWACFPGYILPEQ